MAHHQSPYCELSLVVAPIALCFAWNLTLTGISSWWKQLVPYLVSMVFMKLLVVLPLTLPHISTALLRFGHDTLEYLSPQVQIVFVMAVFPVIMNIIQFCIFDQIIKAGKAGHDGDDDEDKGDEEGGGGYRRVPTGDLEDGGGGGGRTGSRSNSRSFSTNRDRRRRGSSVKGVDSRSNTPVPRSPLLEASSLGSKKDYGSTTPSPRLSGDGGAGTAGTFWQNMLSARQTSAGAAATASTSTSPHDSRYGASSSATATARDDWRSGAPSPDSFRPEPDGPVPPIHLSSQSDASASPPASMETSSHFGHVSRLSEDLGREARRQLSPRSRTSMASVMDSGLGLQDLPT